MLCDFSLYSLSEHTDSFHALCIFPLVTSSENASVIELQNNLLYNVENTVIEVDNNCTSD